MKKSILCFLGLHNWVYSNSEHTFPKGHASFNEDELYRECERCHIKQELVDDGQASGMASMEEWQTVRS